MRHLSLLLLSAASVAFAGTASARDQIRIVGSSTVYPFAASVSEHFGKAGDFRTPVVESTGTGGGMKLFCSGIGADYPDITDASRLMLESEAKTCEANHISFVPVTIGFDGITLANAITSPHFKLTRKFIYLALARDLPDGKGHFVVNPYTRWKQIDASLPDLPIKVYGTPPVSGTRDTFVELVMSKGCLQVKEVAAITSEADRKRRCQMLREDGVFVEAGENGNLIAQKLLLDTQALGIFGFSFLDQNSATLQGSDIEGVTPSFENIQDGSYPISRPLYFYVKKEHLELVAGIREYAGEFLSEGAIGDEGYLVAQGLVPMKEEARRAMRKQTEQALK